jgi:hypothetical protein
VRRGDLVGRYMASDCNLHGSVLVAHVRDVFGEWHLRHILLSHMKYYNEVRTHLSLEKDTPVSRAAERTGHILCRPVLGGLHHQYIRI